MHATSRMTIIALFGLSTMTTGQDNIVNCYIDVVVVVIKMHSKLDCLIKYGFSDYIGLEISDESSQWFLKI